MFFDNVFSMFLGLTSLTKEKVEELTNVLVEKGDMQREEARKVATKILEKGKEEREEYVSGLQQRMETIKDKVVTKDDLLRVESKIDEILRTLQKEGDS